MHYFRLFLILVAVIALFSSTINGNETYRNPGKAAADPCILRKPTGEVVAHEGRYYLYFTGSAPNDHSFVCRWTTDFSQWHDGGVVFDGAGTWARNTYWAPEVYEIDGQYYMFFSAQNSDLPWTKEEHFNIGVAVADRPTGPFQMLTDRPLFEPGYPIIDANLFIDDNGTPYLTYSRCCYQHPVESELADQAREKAWFKSIEESWVYGIQLKTALTGVVGEPTLLLRPPVKLKDTQAEWESRSVTAKEVNRRWTEGSTLFKHQGKYYLMYSANNFAGDYYAVGYATSDHPLGPYVKAENNPVLEKHTQDGGEVRGTGHNNIFFSPDRKEMYCVYHGRTKGESRRLFIDRMEIDKNGVLRVIGPTTTPQRVPFLAGNDVAKANGPNVVVVFVDDMGWTDLSCFGNTAIQTPHIDRLAKEGIAFTQFYVSSPLCSPSRCALSTGQYPYRWRMTSYLDSRQKNEERGVVQWLDPTAPMIARTFQQAGYRTGHFGKWHLGGQRDVGEAPLITEYGFDESLTNFEGLGPRVCPLLNKFDGREPRRHSIGSDLLGRGDIRWIDRNRVTTCYVEKALEFIRHAEADEKPFFINLWPDDVHSPFFPAAKYRGEGSKKELYHGTLVEMDLQLAPLLDYIRENETLRNNTMIVFCSDNGPEPGAGSSLPLRGSKATLYEGGIRSPLIVWGPGLMESKAQGTKNTDTVFLSIDIVPSLLNIAGLTRPEGVVYDGEDFSQILLGRTSRQERTKPLFWRRPPDRPGTTNDPNPDLALRSGKWKFMMQYDGSNPRLYDLEQDVSETNNLVQEQQDLADRFRVMLRTWNETLPQDN